MSMLRRFLGGAFVLLALSITAIGTAAFKIRQADGPSQLFAGGALQSGPLLIWFVPGAPELVDDLAMSIVIAVVY